MEKLSVFVDSNKSSAKAWDDFAIRCGCSYRCGYHASPLTDTEGSIFRKTLRFEIFRYGETKPVKIGQCIVVVSASLRIIADQLQLLPSAEEFWSEAMQAILISIGPGRYRYGSDWMIERPRGEDIARLTGTEVACVQPAFLEVIELSRWAAWDDYWRCVSTNARRNYKKAEQNGVPLRLRECSGIALLMVLHATMRLRFQSVHHKLKDGYRLSMALKTLVRSIVLLNRTTATVCSGGDATLSFATCIHFGRAVSYIEGGSNDLVDGAGWYVLLSTIRRVFEQTGGKGLFVMGPVGPDTMNKPEWQGLARSRQQCRVTQRHVETVTFTYHPDHRRAVEIEPARLEAVG